jgi:hypothetical protein
MNNIIPCANARNYAATHSFTSNDVSDVSDAINAVLRAAGFKHNHSRTILAALAEADGRTEEFSVYFAALGSRLKNRLDPFAIGEELEQRGKQDAQRWRRALTRLNDDQDATQFHFVECVPGGCDRDGHVRKSKIRVDVETFADVVRLARSREDFARSRKFAFEESARQVLGNKRQKVISRFSTQRLSDDEKFERLFKTLENGARRYAEAAVKSGYDLESLEKLVIERIRQNFAQAAHNEDSLHFDTPSPLENESDTVLLEGVSILEGTRPPADEAADAPPMKPPRVSPVEVSTESSIEPLPTVAELPREAQSGARSAAEAEECVALFESVGASSFGVTLLNDATTNSDYSELTTVQLQQHLPVLLKRNSERSTSIIFRPRGAAFLQADDLSPQKLSEVESLAFMTMLTSEGNGQAWFSVKDVAEGSPEHKDLQRRLKDGLKSDKAASGACRMPGSINTKPGRNGFRVRLVASNFNRTVPTTDLEAAGLLPASAPIKAKQCAEPTRASRASRASRIAPNYARCLQDKFGDESAADASFVKIAILRGFSCDEAWAALEHVAPRTKLERDDYRRLTLAFVEH